MSWTRVTPSRCAFPGAFLAIAVSPFRYLEYRDSPGKCQVVFIIPNALTFELDQSVGAGHRYIRIALQGFVPGGTSPRASASENIFDRTVTTLLAW